MKILARVSESKPTCEKSLCAELDLRTVKVNTLEPEIGVNKMLSSKSPHRLAFKILTALLFILPAYGHAQNAPRIENFEQVEGPPMESFDLLEGVWAVESHSLRRRMAEEQEWLENHMETKYRILLGGLVAINDTYGTFNDRPMHGIMIRTYDPDIDEWKFQWMSVGYPHITEQVRGGFENGVGVFYGEETNEGRTFKMRFRWKMISESHAFWEQSYQDPISKEWEINWTLDLRRKH